MESIFVKMLCNERPIGAHTKGLEYRSQFLSDLPINPFTSSGHKAAHLADGISADRVTEISSLDWLKVLERELV